MWQQFSQMVDWTLLRKSFIIIPITRKLRTLIENGCGHSLEWSEFKELQKMCRAWSESKLLATLMVFLKVLSNHFHINSERKGMFIKLSQTSLSFGERTTSAQLEDSLFEELILVP